MQLSNVYGDLSSVERFDPATERWEKVPDMSVKRNCLGVVALFAGCDGSFIKGCDD